MYRQCSRKIIVHHLDVLLAPTDSPAKDLIKGSLLAVIRDTINITILVSLRKSIPIAFRQHPPRSPSGDRQARHPIAKQQQQEATSLAPPQCRWHTDPCVTNITLLQVSLRRTHLES
jgi:hypothetical protein